jgi:hypothetical protein
MIAAELESLLVMLRRNRVSKFHGRELSRNGEPNLDVSVEFAPPTASEEVPIEQRVVSIPGASHFWKDLTKAGPGADDSPPGAPDPDAEEDPLFWSAPAVEAPVKP